uniref:ADP-ribosyl cyclase/cyclic ADP-ribose hydrolase n=1 Tax=Mola mola TaxID=94237 RepID=A0A3Q3WAV4_MOLML
MASGGSGSAERRRRKRCLVFGLLTVLVVVVVVAVVLAVTLRKGKYTFEDRILARCEKFKGSDCRLIWAKFQKAYVGRDPCNVPMEAYDDFIAATQFKPECNRMMFWSKTKDVVHDFTEKRDCYVTLEDTLLGSVADGLTWCGRVGSSETLTTGCPRWTDCENNPVRSFWSRASAAFAEKACGNVTVMLNGSIETPFSPNSTFRSIEVKKFDATVMRSLNVVLVTQTNSVSNCTNASLKDLQKELAAGIRYSCKEVSEAQIRECSSNPEKPCGACW